MTIADLAVNQVLEKVTITDTAAQGNTLLRWQGKVVFIRAGAVGDIADILITEVHSHYAKATVTQVHTAGPSRVEPKCEHYAQCGGCQLQHIDYAAQSQFTEQEAGKTLAKISGLTLPAIRRYHAAQQPWESRNKLSFAFSHNVWQPEKQREKQKGVGFHQLDAPTSVIAVDHCWLMPKQATQYANGFKQQAEDNELSFWNHAKRHGLLREFIIRRNQLGEYMVILHVSYEDDTLTRLAQALFDQEDAIKSVYLAINWDKTDDMRDAQLTLVAGEATLVDQLGDLTFAISPKAFYQTNAHQAHVLFERAKVLAKLSKNDTVYDLYCGTGTIGLSLADAAKKVIGIELVQDAIDDAKRNAALNAIENVSFHCGRAETLITSQFIKTHGKPDIVIVDPPRAGLDTRLCQQLNTLKPKRLIYISCDPATQARDFKRLSSSYDVKTIEVVDMFPQSYHCETVALLTPKTKPTVKVTRGLKY